MDHAPDATSRRPQRDDIHFLAAALGRALSEAGPPELVDISQAVLTSAKADRMARTSDPHGQTPSRLALTMGSLSLATLQDVVRAFCDYLGLCNMAERVGSIRRQTLAESLDKNTGGNCFDALFLRLRRHGMTSTQILESVRALGATPVFTAHPTEATRKSLLRKEQHIAQDLLAHASGAQDLEAQQDLSERVVTQLSAAWQTDVLADAPTVADESEHVCFYLTDVIYRIVPTFYFALMSAMRRVLRLDDATIHEACFARPCGPLLRFGTWVGGDMDGNPNVGPDTIIDTLLRQRKTLLARYHAEVQALLELLSQSEGRIGVSNELGDLIRRLQRELEGVQVPARHKTMPYRVLLHHVSHRLMATLNETRDGYKTPATFIDELEIVYQSLMAHKGQHAGAKNVLSLIIKARVFGFHLATLDLRQDSLVHRRAIGQLLRRDDWLMVSPQQRADSMQAVLQDHDVVHVIDGEATPNNDALQLCMRVMRAIVACRHRFGGQALGPYIISMATHAEDVLAVLLLARASGMAEPMAMDVAPLFETVPDLERAPYSFAAMLASSYYRQHLQSRNDTQHIMLGYSDSNKAAGLVASRWALQRAQVALNDVAQAHAIAIEWFHGRGGTVSRGGTKTRDAILAAPRGLDTTKLRVTEQGEIIHSRYGLDGLALLTFKTMAQALIEARHLGQTFASPSTSTSGGAPSGACAKAMDLLSAASLAAYRALVTDSPEFFNYFLAATPIDVIGRLNIGSRPASRRSQKTVDDLRAIPWVFAWTQNRQLLPGWYGLGHGLNAVREQMGEAVLRSMAAQWPFFANMLADAQMVLAKFDVVVAERWAQLAGPLAARFWPMIDAAYHQTVSEVLRTLGLKALLDDEPILKKAIRARNAYIDPISWAQLRLLPTWRASDYKDTQVGQVLLLSVKAMARGMQNTG